MYKQGCSLGSQLAIFMPELSGIIDDARTTRRKVWFLGRDCDVFYGAFASMGNRNPGKQSDIGYISGLNRENARKLAHRGKLCQWLKSIGVKENDILVDSGYHGSIYDRIIQDNEKWAMSISMVLITGTSNSTGWVLHEVGSDHPLRHAILALEHSPKIEIVSWDEKRRVPKVRSTEDRATKEFYFGVVDVLKRYAW